MRSKPVLVGLIAALALASSLVVTTVVLGHTEKTVVRDQRDPNRAARCDIRKATAKVVKEGRQVRHTVTVRGALPYDSAAPFVFLKKSRTSSLLDDPSVWLHPNVSGEYRFTDQLRTVVYTFKRKDLPAVFRSRKEYFWFASVCSYPGAPSDDAPNNGVRRQSLKRHDHH